MLTINEDYFSLFEKENDNFCLQVKRRECQKAIVKIEHSIEHPINAICTAY